MAGDRAEGPSWPDWRPVARSRSRPLYVLGRPLTERRLQRLRW